MSEESEEEDPTAHYAKPNCDGFFADIKNENESSVCVAVRIRPLIAKELMSKHVEICVESDDKMAIMGKDRGFPFDYVFDQECEQEEVYEICVRNLILGCFEGFNATVLAYG